MELKTYAKKFQPIKLTPKAKEMALADEISKAYTIRRSFIFKYINEIGYQAVLENFIHCQKVAGVKLFIWLCAKDRKNIAWKKS